MPVERHYLDTTLHPSIRFDVHPDGTTIMYVWGTEVARKKLYPGVRLTRIMRAFMRELAVYGIGIDPAREIEKMRREIAKLKDEIERLKRRR